MKESEGNDVSVWEPKRLRGSVPVEENSETSPGWTEEENMAAWVKKFEQPERCHERLFEILDSTSATGPSGSNQGPTQHRPVY